MTRKEELIFCTFFCNLAKEVESDDIDLNISIALLAGGMLIDTLRNLDVNKLNEAKIKLSEIVDLKSSNLDNAHGIVLKFLEREDENE